MWEKEREMGLAAGRRIVRGANDVSVHSVCIVSVCGLSGVCVRVRACLECGMCQVRVSHVCARAVCGRLGKAER